MDWHRLFGLALRDLFAGSPFAVEIELDLSAKKQLLDLVILRKTGGEFAGRLPDGLEPLTNYNLITFKSFWQALDDWALKELIGHYVNYRKFVSPALDRLLPEEQFRLVAVCARFPQSLHSQVGLIERQEGVFDCRWGTDEIRIVVMSRIPERDHNALLNLFSGQAERIHYGVEHYRPRSPDTSTLLTTLFEYYQGEGLTVPYTMEEFKREFVKEHLSVLTPEERLKGLPAEERLKGLPAEERIKGMTLDDLEQALSHEEYRELVKRLKANEPKDETEP